MLKIKRILSLLLALCMLASILTFCASAEFDQAALSSGVYQFNVVHSVKIPELDNTSFTVWLSALCFAAGSSPEGNSYVITDAGMAGNSRIYDTLGDKFIEFFESKGKIFDKSELAEHIEITYTAYYAVYAGNHVELTPVENNSTRDIMLFESASPLPTVKYTYAYADEAKADNIVHSFALNGTDVDGIVSSKDDAYITNWSLSTIDGKISIPADVQDGSSAYTYINMLRSRAAQGSPVFDDEGNVIGLNVWSDIYDGAAAITSTAIMNILDSVGISYDVTQMIGNGIKTSDIMVYIYIAAVIVIILVVMLIVLRSRKKKIEAEESAAKFSPKRPKLEPASAPVQSAKTQVINSVPKNPSAAPAAPAAPRSVVLTVLGGPMQGYSKEVGEPLILGRDPEKCNVVFPADLTCVSRVHCTVTYNKLTGRILLEDLNSSNGTYFPSGSRIIPGRLYALRNGDRFYLGLAENTVEVRMK